ncbi:MAG: DNA internalization-related competence protein ComEC/Rec2 [Geobacteraceae bacterium]|nr:DNA internalization-related competence protein ComEC/Rec2 [Geobacteraceae bacterium]NTW80390.1 DNA internalization-related competence protein ComEC/Rec2 [Geobacteraceae bacterium]
MVLSVFIGYFSDTTTVVAAFLCLLLAVFVRNSYLFSAITALFFFLWGLSALQPWLSPETSPYSIRNMVSGTPIVIEGVITTRPSVSPDGSRLTVRVESVNSGNQTETATGLLLLYVSEGYVYLARGDRIRFISRISVPRRLGLPGEFDYPRYLALQGISATGRVASQADIVLIRGAAVESPQRTIDMTARHLGDAIRKSIPDERVSSVLTALLIGDQRRIPAELAEAYTRAGVNHILSISGFHIGIIAAFITLLVIWLLTRFEYPALRWNVRRIAVLIAIPAMLAYLFLTGNAPATARSVIMLVVFAVALFVERERDSINTLLLAAFSLVAINPPTLFDISFQLSFLSLWGILIAVPLFMKYKAAVNSQWLRSTIQFLSASVAASLVTLLPVLFFFKVASINGILTNFLIVPLLGYGAVLAGFIALPLVVLFPSFAPLLLWPAAALVAISNQFIMWCTSLPVLAFHGITSWDMFFFLLFMGSMTFLRGRFLLTVTGLLIVSTAFALHLFATTASDGRLHITMLSVGQAESLLLKLPDGSALLIDGGGYLHETGNDFGQRLLAPALGALRTVRVDTMIATHDHPDHSGGLPFIIKNFPVGQFWSGPEVSAEVQRELLKGSVLQRTITAGDVLALPGPVTITVLSPAGYDKIQADGDESSTNEQSLVFRLSYGTFSMIFCADAGFEAELRMLAGRYDLKSTVLKVGHHGSRYSTSEAFLEKVKPALALISVGAGNRFGLPSARTVDLLRSKKIPVYRTDRDGTIELVTDGVGWSVSTPYKPD